MPQSILLTEIIAWLWSQKDQGLNSYSTTYYVDNFAKTWAWFSLLENKEETPEYLARGLQ